MKLSDILQLLKNISKDIGTEAFLVGGVPRDRILGILDKEDFDIDITTGDNKIQYLAKDFIYQLGKNYNINHKQSQDGHISVYTPNLKIDFSSNFITPHIVEKLKEKNIFNPTPLQKEMWSRDFTCNSLLLDLDLKKVIDTTKLGIQDIKSKLLRTCLDPQETFSYNTNRIPRLIYLSCKLDFSIDPIIREWLLKNGKIITKCKPEYITKLLNKSLAYNKQKTFQLLSTLNLWDYVPITEELIVGYNNRMINKKSQLFQNYDYTNSKTGPGTGLYRAMDDGEVKSVSEFRKKRRNKRKKIIKQIKDMKSVWKGNPNK